MTAKKPFGLPSMKLVMLAAVAGVIAGAAAVYVKEAGYGNGVGETASADQCGTARERAAALTPFTKGQVAAMTMG